MLYFPGYNAPPLIATPIKEGKTFQRLCRPQCRKNRQNFLIFLQFFSRNKTLYNVRSMLSVKCFTCQTQNPYVTYGLTFLVNTVLLRIWEDRLRRKRVKPRTMRPEINVQVHSPRHMYSPRLNILRSPVDFTPVSK